MLGESLVRERTVKIYISPSPKDYTEDGRGSGGIWRVITAQAKHLPEYGIEIVDDPEDADIVNVHAGEIFPTKKPIVQNLHGYYWTGDFPWSSEYWQYNANVIQGTREAAAIISPSEWVAYPVRRDTRKNVIVIPHGVDIESLPERGEDRGYVLWGKPRVDTVCDPSPVNKLAQMAPDVQFWTTFGRPTGNVKVVGVHPHDEFQEILSGASVWLATARETGDIASREAMAMCIPVLGWNHGATAELVIHKETGYLARVGNYGDLLEGLRYCLENRERLGKAAREHIIQNYQWKGLAARYAEVFKDVLRTEIYLYDVSIIVPAYNYARFLPECLNSVLGQKFSGTVEIHRRE